MRNESFEIKNPFDFYLFEVIGFGTNQRTYLLNWKIFWWKI